MPVGNDRMPDKEALIRFIGSDAGKALLRQLNSSDPNKLKAAAEKASSGDIGGAMSVLRTILSSNGDRDDKEDVHGK